MPGPLAQSEPAQLLLDPPPAQITRLRCPVSYVITQQDRVTPAAKQRLFARRLTAREIQQPGGHIVPLNNTGWLSQQALLDDKTTQQTLLRVKSSSSMG